MDKEPRRLEVTMKSVDYQKILKSIQNGNIFIRCHSTINFVDEQHYIQYRLEHAFYEMKLLLVIHSSIKGAKYPLFVIRLSLSGQGIPAVFPIDFVGSYSFSKDLKRWSQSPFEKTGLKFPVLLDSWIGDYKWWSNPALTVFSRQISVNNSKKGDILFGGVDTYHLLYLAYMVNRLYLDAYLGEFKGDERANRLTAAGRLKGYLDERVRAYQSTGEFIR